MIQIFFAPANILVTVLMLIVIFYWLTVLLGVLDIDAFDLDFDIDVDADVEGPDIDTDLDSSNIFGINWILRFFNLGKVPFMIFLTFLVLPWWFGTVIVNNIFTFTSFLPGLLVTVVVFFGALFVSKLLTQPFVKIFAILDKDDENADVLGSIGEVTMPASSIRTGQAEFKINNSYLTINIRTTNELTVNSGDTVYIIDHDKSLDYYIVEPYNL